MRDKLRRICNPNSDLCGNARSGRSMLPMIVTSWVILIAVAFTALLTFHNMPGERSDHGTIWPANKSITLDTQRANLVVFIHPKCPCSVATLSELARIQSACGARVSTQVVFYSPADMQWKDTSKVRQALAIPNVRITNDVDGKLAEQFGALTSGHSLLYSSDGRRVFRGGITPARGHEGENPGRSSVIRYVLEGNIGCEKTNVFGCPILDQSSEIAINSRGSDHGIE